MRANLAEWGYGQSWSKANILIFFLQPFPKKTNLLKLKKQINSSFQKFKKSKNKPPKKLQNGYN